MTTAKLTACYSAMAGAQAVTFATVELHHYKGHDRRAAESIPNGPGFGA
jgi:hypothetical protein